MKIYLTARHYIFNELSAEFLEAAVNRLQNAKELEKKNIILSILVSANIKKLPDKVRDKTFSTIKRVADFGIPVRFSDEGLTAGQKLVSELFENNAHTSEKEVIYGLFDIDQFLLKKRAHIGAVISLAKKMLKENSLLSLGSRDVPVILSYNPEVNRLRIIHELIHSLVPEKKPFVAAFPSWNTQADSFYREIGESTPGFYLINPANHSYETLKKEVYTNKELYTVLPGFSAEYFIPLWAAINSSLTTGYVYSTRNMQWIFPSLEEETTKAKEFIGTTTKQLAKTSLAPSFIKVLSDKEKLFSELKRFFTAEEISTVSEIMKSNIT